jgi:hypothetical protein
MAETEVRLDECLCPDQGHADGDTIRLRSTLDFQSVRAVRYASVIAQQDDPEASVASLMAVISEGYIMHGVESWTLEDHGKPIEPTKANVRQYLLTNIVAAQWVSDFADALYQPQVMLPLARLAERSLRLSQTNGSTSAQNGSSLTSMESDESSSPSPKPRKRSKRSSTTSTPTVSIVTSSTGSAGDSES